MPPTTTTDADVTGDGPPSQSQPPSNPSSFLAEDTSKADDESRYQHVLATVFAPQEGIHRRTQRAEYELVQSCREKKGMRHYEAPPNNDLGSEPQNKRKARHLRIHHALQDEDERTARLSQRRAEEKQKRKDVKEGLYKRIYKTKKSENDGKEEENDGQRDCCLCCHKRILAGQHCLLRKVEGTCGCCHGCINNPKGKCHVGKCSGIYLTPPKKEKIEIKGKGGFPLCACANITHAKYISVDPPSLGCEIEYYARDKEDTADHLFSVEFSNLRAYSTWYVCPKDEILSCEIHINGKKVGTIGECTYTTAEKFSRPGHLLITHHFSFDHNTEHCILCKSSVNEKGTTPWGFCETFSLNLLLGPLPIGVAADVEKCLQSSGSKRLKDFDYGVVSRGGMMLSSVQFLDITFRETSMKWGDPLHFVAWKVIWEKKAGRSLTEMELGKIQSEWEKMDSYSVIETFKRWDPFYRCSKKGCNSISTPFRICAVHRGREPRCYCLGHDPRCNCRETGLILE